jgi:hypothetical protein
MAGLATDVDDSPGSAYDNAFRFRPEDLKLGDL